MKSGYMNVLFGYSMYHCSDHIKLFRSNIKIDRNRKLKSIEQLELLDPNSTNIFANNFIDNLGKRL